MNSQFASTRNNTFLNSYIGRRAAVSPTTPPGFEGTHPETPVPLPSYHFQPIHPYPYMAPLPQYYIPQMTHPSYYQKLSYPVSSEAGFREDKPAEEPRIRPLMSSAPEKRRPTDDEMRRFKRAYRRVPCNPDAAFTGSPNYSHGMAPEFTGFH